MTNWLRLSCCTFVSFRLILTLSFAFFLSAVLREKIECRRQEPDKKPNFPVAVFYTFFHTVTLHLPPSQQPSLFRNNQSCLFFWAEQRFLQLAKYFTLALLDLRFKGRGGETPGKTMIFVYGTNLWRIFAPKWFPTVVQAVQLSELIQLCVIYCQVNPITSATAYFYSIIMSDDNSDSAPSNDTDRGAGGVEKKAGLVNRSCGMRESSLSSNPVNSRTGSSPGGVSDPKGSAGDTRGINSDDTDGLSSGNDSGERESEGGNGSRGRQSNRSYQSSSSQNGKDSGMCLETTESNKRWEIEKGHPKNLTL